MHARTQQENRASEHEQKPSSTRAKLRDRGPQEHDSNIFKNHQEQEEARAYWSICIQPPQMTLSSLKMRYPDKLSSQSLDLTNSCHNCWASLLRLRFAVLGCADVAAFSHWQLEQLQKHCQHQKPPIPSHDRWQTVDGQHFSREQLQRGSWS